MLPNPRQSEKADSHQKFKDVNKCLGKKQQECEDEQEIARAEGEGFGNQSCQSAYKCDNAERLKMMNGNNSECH